DAGTTGNGASLLDALDEAQAARLIEETRGSVATYTFTHALVRQTLLSDLTFARRTRWHRQIADALAQQRDPDPAALASHYCGGAPAGAIVEAIEWSKRAAAAAHERLAFEEALPILERALHVLELEKTPDVRSRADLRLCLFGARQAIGDSDGAKHEAL